jgi:hypothetical protein
MEALPVLVAVFQAQPNLPARTDGHYGYHLWDSLLLRAMVITEIVFLLTILNRLILSVSSR